MLKVSNQFVYGVELYSVSYLFVLIENHTCTLSCCVMYFVPVLMFPWFALSMIGFLYLTCGNWVTNIQ